jgi:hypothetical protein
MANAPEAPLAQVHELLRRRDFRLLFTARTASVLGNAVVPVAVAFAVLGLTGSATDLGLVLAARFVPQIVFLLVGGVWADRLPRQRVMVGADVVAGVSQGLAAVLLLTGRLELWQLIALEAVNGAAFAFFFPASTGLIPQTVPPALLQGANALLRLSSNAVTMLGAALAGVIVAAAGPGEALALDSATFLFSAACCSLLRVSGAAGRAGRRFLGDLLAGWREFTSRRWLWVVVAQFSIVNAAHAGAFLVLGPVVADRSLGGAAVWGMIVAAEAAGFVAGGLLGLRFRPRRPLLAGSVGVLLWAPPLALLALEAPPAVIAAAAVVGGLGAETFGVQWDTSLQGHVPGGALSRVSSYDALGSLVLMPLGLAVAGPVAAAVGTEAAIWCGCALIVVPTAAVLLVEEVRKLPRTAAGELG